MFIGVMILALVMLHKLCIQAELVVYNIHTEEVVYSNPQCFLLDPA